MYDSGDIDGPVVAANGSILTILLLSIPAAWVGYGKIKKSFPGIPSRWFATLPLLFACYLTSLIIFTACLFVFGDRVLSLVAKVSRGS
jgi:hypothetical protein